jgi:hypothetical protein
MSYRTVPLTLSDEEAARLDQHVKSRAIHVGIRGKGTSIRVMFDEDLLRRILDGSPEALRHVSASSIVGIEPRRVRWLWDERVPQGAITLLGGREGIGKSILAYTLAAQVTQGTLEGERFGDPRPVIVVAHEDSWPHTIVPRLMAAGANLGLIHRVTVTVGHVETGSLVLPLDIEELGQVVFGLGAALVVLDPIISRLDAGLDTHHDAEVRRALEPLAEAADRGNFSVLGLIHLNKSKEADPLTMLMASRAFAAVARAVLFVTMDPEQPEMRLLGQPKNNLGRTGLDTRMFDVVGDEVGKDEGKPIVTGKLRWCGTSERTILDALHDAARSPSAREQSREAEGWLREYLRVQRVMSSSEVKAAAADEGIAERTLHRARERIGAGVVRRGFQGGAFWAAPGMTPDEVDAELKAQDRSSVPRARGE